MPHLSKSLSRDLDPAACLTPPWALGSAMWTSRGGTKEIKLGTFLYAGLRGHTNTSAPEHFEENLKLRNLHDKTKL